MLLTSMHIFYCGAYSFLFHSFNCNCKRMMYLSTSVITDTMFVYIMTVYRGCKVSLGRQKTVSREMQECTDSMGDLKEKAQKIQMTFISRCVSILIKIKFIPLKKGQAFHLFTSETLWSFFLYYVTSILLFSFSYIFFRVSMNTTKSQTLDSLELTDLLSYLGFNLTNFFLFPLLPLIIGHAAGQAADISLCPSLPWPVIGWKIILCELFYALGYALSIIPSIVHYAAESFQDKCLFIILSIICLCSVCIIVALCVIISQVLVFSWMDKLGDTAEAVGKEINIQKHARSCVENYNNLNQALSIYFFFNFAVLQFSWIFTAYLSVTNLINLDNSFVIERHGSMLLLGLKSFGMFLMSLCCLWHLLHMVMEAEKLKKR